METAQAHDPREVIDHRPMSGFQWGIVTIMVGLNALDGFDVLSISFASPGISAEWGVDRAALGVVLSMELIGMAVGSLFLGRLADRVGRRATILGCLLVMAAGMFGAATVGGITSLSLWRVVTGLGIGGMLAATNAAVAEASNLRRRSLAVVLMAAGYPLGTVVGGSISTALLTHYDWRVVFLFGGVVTLLFIPLVLWRAPESISFLMQKDSPRAHARINATLRRMGHPEATRVADADAVVASPAKVPFTALFSRAYWRPTAMLTVAYFAHIMTFYYILKWIPKIVTDLGYPAPLAGGVLVWASIGGMAGSVLLGLLSARVRVAALTIAAMVASTAAVIVFGQGARDLDSLSAVAAMAGFATNAGVVGLYALVAAAFPTALRASATGFVIGIGRGSSALAPALAGLLFSVGNSLATVSLIMALGSLVAAAALVAGRAGRSA